MQNKDIAKTVSVRRQKSPLYLILISIVVVVVLICGFFILKDKVNYIEQKDVKIGNEVFILEVADTEGARTKGLSERDNLDKNRGMLFDFKKDGDWRMWMLQMRFSIDIAWLDESGNIIFIKADANPGSYPEVYHAGKPSRYVIEVPAGTFERLSIKVGDKLDL